MRRSGERATGVADAPGGDADIAELRTRVYGVEAGLQRIEGLIASLSVKFDTQSRTPWGIIFSGIGLMGGALVGYMNIQLQPIGRELDRTTAVIEKLSERFVPAAEVERRFADAGQSTEQRFSDMQRQIDDAKHALSEHAFNRYAFDQSAFDRRAEGEGQSGERAPGESSAVRPFGRSGARTVGPLPR